MNDRDRLLAAVGPLITAIGGTVIEPDDVTDGDIPIQWEGRPVFAVRPASLEEALDNLIGQVETELGARLAVMTRAKKQRSIRLLDERGAFAMRRAVERVADAMGVSRITVYNYLNAIRNDRI